MGESEAGRALGLDNKQDTYLFTLAATEQLIFTAHSDGMWTTDSDEGSVVSFSGARGCIFEGSGKESY